MGKRYSREELWALARAGEQCRGKLVREGAGRLSAVMPYVRLVDLNRSTKGADPSDPSVRAVEVGVKGSF